jgi:hypothetical protein
MRQARETAFRDKSLLSKRYRQAKSSGDFGKAMEVAQQADKMGMPVGTTGSFDQLAQTGQRRYEQGMFRAGMEQEKTGLDAFDFRQAAQRGAAGVGGFDFRQAAQRRVMPPAQDMVPTEPSGQKVPPVPLSTTVPGTELTAPPQQQGGAAPRPELVSQFTDIWGKAKTQGQKDSVLLAAYKAGVPLNDFGNKELLRATSNFLPEQPPAKNATPVAPSSRMVEVNPSGYTVATDEGKKYMQAREQMFLKDPAFAKRRADAAAADSQRRDQFNATEYARRTQDQQSIDLNEKARQDEMSLFDAEVQRKQQQQAETLYDLEQRQVDTGNRMKALSREEKASNSGSLITRMPQNTERMYLDMTRPSARKRIQNQGRLTRR